MLLCSCFVNATLCKWRSCCNVTRLSSAGRSPMSQMPEGSVQKSATYAASLLSALSELRSQDLFCDVTLVSDDGTFQTKVHKIVLVAASGYLKSLLLDPDLTIHDYITVPSMWTDMLSSCVVTWFCKHSVNVSCPNSCRGWSHNIRELSLGLLLTC